jgi:hypothetical protein
MKTVIISALALVLSGCISLPADDLDGETAAPSTSQSMGIEEQVFVKIVREGTNLTGTDDEFISAGRLICNEFDRGKTFESVGYDIVESGASFEDAGFIIGASIGAFCPQYSDVVQQGV